MTYSRANPSPRYTQLVDLYRQMHEEGVQEVEKTLEAQKTFNGKSLLPHVTTIKALIDKFGAKTVLDYGAGKGISYRAAIFPSPDGRSKTDLRSYWDVDEIRLYDPGHEPFAELPIGQKFDAVISTDVMEHIPEQDMDWVIDELYGFANKFVYTCIATYPAGKLFPNGENVHVTLKDVRWWVQKFEERREATGTTAEYVILIFSSAGDRNPVVVTSY